MGVCSPESSHCTHTLARASARVVVGDVASLLASDLDEHVHHTKHFLCLDRERGQALLHRQPFGQPRLEVEAPDEGRITVRKSRVLPKKRERTVSSSHHNRAVEVSKESTTEFYHNKQIQF
jgi:hypothetical protein